MQIEIKTLDGRAAGSAELPDALFGAKGAPGHHRPRDALAVDEAPGRHAPDQRHGRSVRHDEEAV